MVRETRTLTGARCRLGPGTARFSRRAAPIRRQRAAERPRRTELARRRTVLIVDDEPTVLSVGTMMLEDAGYRVIAAEDGETAVDIASADREPIDCVLLDYLLPGMNGLETLRRLARIDPARPVILWSGCCTADERSELMESGAHGVLSKPVDLDALVGRIREAIESP